MVVELIDLQKPGANGKIGILWEFLPDLSRWRVLVEGESEYFLLKPENIKPVELQIETYKSPDCSQSSSNIRPKAWEVWAEPDSLFTADKIMMGTYDKIPILGLYHFPINSDRPNEVAEQAWLKKNRKWKDPQGFNPVDGFFSDGGHDGKYMYFDNGNNSSPINHWANRVLAVTPETITQVAERWNSWECDCYVSTTHGS